MPCWCLWFIFRVHSNPPNVERVEEFTNIFLRRWHSQHVGIPILLQQQLDLVHVPGWTQPDWARKHAFMSIQGDSICYAELVTAQAVQACPSLCMLAELDFLARSRPCTSQLLDFLAAILGSEHAITLQWLTFQVLGSSPSISR